jgi:hypothetical protein
MGNINFLISYVTPILRIFSFYNFDSLVHYNGDVVVFIEDKHLIEFPIIGITFVTDYFR